MNLPRITSIDASAVRRSVRERSSSSASRFPSLPPCEEPPLLPVLFIPRAGRLFFAIGTTLHILSGWLP